MVCMQTKEFVRFLIDKEMPVFTLKDAEKITHAPRGYLRLFLHRCVKSGAIARAERGVYYVKARSNEYEVASHIVYPSYISLISALHYYGLTTQIPHVIYVVSPERHGRIGNVWGFEILFKRIKLPMMFGYHKEPGGNIFIADPEKAIVDIFYFGDVNDLDESVFDKPSRIDIKKLIEYAMRSGEPRVINGVRRLLSEHVTGKRRLPPNSAALVRSHAG